MKLTYDAEGNLTQRGSGNNYDSLSFQSFGCALKQIQKVRGGSVQETISYGYDGMGQRVKMTDSEGTRYFLYDGLMPVLELDSGKNTTASYVYGANGVIYRRKHLPGGDEYEYHHVNALGSLAIITDDNESVVARYEYDAFGAVRHQWGDSDNTRKFTGKEYDSDVKLYYYGARYYDAYIGRFISRDPAGDGINWYVYCRNNPLRFIDPTGLETLYSRGVTGRELAAMELVYEDVAEPLADYITVVVVTDDDERLIIDGRQAAARCDANIIYLSSSNEGPDGAISMLLFIHESAHAWQHLTGLHRGGQGGVDYTYTEEQLANLELKREEHASAIEASYLLLADSDPTHKNSRGAYPSSLAGNLSFQLYMSGKTGVTLGDVRSQFTAQYGAVLSEVRDINNIPLKPWKKQRTNRNRSINGRRL
jgi:RHS repeat-associated protein